ncbi:enoyl-CoA hydratase-related protein [Chloroflexota bacterium]
MTYETIIYEKKDKIAYITLNRPRVLNAINGQMFREMHEALYDVRDDPEVWVAIISGAGDRAFSSGHDLKEDTDEGFEEEWKTSFWKPRSPSIFGTLEIWKPLIAAINGYCLAGGLEVALACDMRIATESACFGMSEVLRALVPGQGGVQRLPRVVPLAIAMELLLTGDMIDAQEAYRIGLVNKVVSFPELMPTAETLAGKICNNGPLTVRAIKESAMRGLDLPLEHALRLNSTLTHINHTTEDSMEGPRAFIEKRKPVYKGR